MKNRVSFRVVNLIAVAQDGIPLEWQQHEFDSGPLMIELDPDAKEPSTGSLDYLERRARVEFRVTLKFPGCARMLEELGASPEFSSPLRAVIHSSGSILEDHSFQLSGRASVSEHPLFDDHAQGSVLPGT